MITSQILDNYFKNINKNINKNKKVLLLLIVVISILIILFVIKYIWSKETIEGFSKLKDFMERNNSNKDIIKGTKYDKLVHNMKSLEEEDNNTTSFLSELFTNLDDEDTNNDTDNKIINFNSSGSKASTKNIKNNIKDYYNSFNDERFSKKCDTTIESLQKFKHFKDEFWNIFKY